MTDLSLQKLKIERTPGVSIRRKRGWLKWVILALLVLAVAAVVMNRRNAPLKVETTTVANAFPTQSFTVLNATGYVVAQRKASVASKASGRLEWLGVLEGSRVRQGEVIARLENRDVTATLEQAAANVMVAKANLEQGMAELRDAESAFRRSKDLLAKGFISSAANDQAAARFNKAQASISALKAGIAAAQANQRAGQVNLEQTVIRAPFDGIILTKNANVGDNVTPFSSAADTRGAVATMADMDTLEVEADVSESNLSKISVGQPCEILLEAFPDLRLAGQVSRIVPTVDRSKATVLMKIKFLERDPRVLPDMSAKVAFLTRPATAEDRKPVAALQAAAIVERDGKKVAFQISGNKVKQINVGSGAKLGDLFAVEGLKAGDKVVLNPDEKLRDGMQIAVETKA